MDAEPSGQEGVRQTIEAALRGVRGEHRQRAHRAAERKDAVARFGRYVDLLNELLQAGPGLLPGTSLQADVDAYHALCAGVERVWDDASRLFLAGSYPLAVFTAILCLEETGKVGVERFRVVLNDACRRGEPVAPAASDRRKSPFYSHRKKHLLAAGAGALINARLDRLVGLERVAGFLDDVETGQIERIRQQALYIDRAADGTAVLPYETVGRETAEFYVVLAGEMMAETLGVEPDHFYRLLEKAQAFERSLGLPGA